MVPVRETGFAEFASGLLTGVLDAVIGAELDQVRKRAELQQAALLDDEAFARAWLSQAQVAAAVAAARAAGTDAVDPTAVRLALARQQRGLLQTVLERGLPRLLVDHGRVSARLMFSVDETGDSSGGLRLRATPVQARSPEFLRLQTNITSEVEISFKTVSE
jgi:hypothetical protein